MYIRTIVSDKYMCLREIQLKLYLGTSIFIRLVFYYTMDQLISLLTKTNSSLIQDSHHTVPTKHCAQSSYIISSAQSRDLF